MARRTRIKKVDYSAVSDILVPYRRVSTREQVDKGAGLGAQKTTISRALEYRGQTALTWDCVDEGLSGKNMTRPELVKALAHVRAGEAGGIVVSKLDRLSRSIQDFAFLTELAVKEGWNLVLLDLNIDLSTPTGKMMANMLAIIAQFEREIIGQRTKDALAEKREQGVRLGRPRTMDDDLLTEIVRLYLGTDSFTAVANLMNEQEVPTIHGGKMWYPATIRKVLRSQDAQPLMALLAEAA